VASGAPRDYSTNMGGSRHAPRAVANANAADVPATLRTDRSAPRPVADESKPARPAVHPATSMLDHRPETRHNKMVNSSSRGSQVAATALSCGSPSCHKAPDFNSCLYKKSCAVVAHSGRPMDGGRCPARRKARQHTPSPVHRLPDFRRSIWRRRSPDKLRRIPATSAHLPIQHARRRLPNLEKTTSGCASGCRRCEDCGAPAAQPTRPINRRSAQPRQIAKSRPCSGMGDLACRLASLGESSLAFTEPPSTRTAASLSRPAVIRELHRS